MIELLSNIWAVYLDTAFWLLVGLIAAGLVKAFIPENAMQRWLGGRGFSAVGRAALFGAPLPLCSCGVLPAALGIRRSGASKEATVSFLISTPETSVDSVAVTYALMGPVMAVYRPLAALVTAIVTGMMTVYVDDGEGDSRQSAPAESCCAKQQAVEQVGACCSNTSHSMDDSHGACCASPVKISTNRFHQALQFAGSELLDDISKWLFIGIAAAGVITTIIPPGWLEQWGQGLSAMLVMALVGVPMYICAVASTPIAASLLIAGVSPGTVLVFLLVGPATNIASLILISKELGRKVTAVYLAGITIVSIVMGLVLDGLIANMGFSVIAEIGDSYRMLPEWLALSSALLLLILAFPRLRNQLMPFLRY